MKFIFLILLSLPIISQAMAETIAVEINKETEYFALSTCKEAGFQKLSTQAKSYGISVDMDSLRITGISDRSSLMSTTIYTWWSVDITDINGREDVFGKSKNPVLTKLVQFTGDECL